MMFLFLACAPAPHDSADATRAVDSALPCGVDAPERSSVTLPTVRLDVACQGDGPTILMLHGFPEFWMGWSAVMPLLADEYRVVAPDQRGYNTSEKFDAVADYGLSMLVADIDHLIDSLDGEVVLVGHDWGGAVAWAVAHAHPDKIEKLVIMNAPHLNVFADLLANDPAQAQAFSYAQFFMSDGAEDTLSANDYALMAGFFEGVLTEEALADYKAAWAEPGALTGGLNWYRANLDADGMPTIEDALTITVPTLVLWGMDDTALLPSNLDGLPDYVSDLQIIEVPGATHWIAHEEPVLVADAIRSFLTE